MTTIYSVKNFNHGLNALNPAWGITLKDENGYYRYGYTCTRRALLRDWMFNCYMGKQLVNGK